MTQNEIWKDIPGYEGFYQASNLGRIKSLLFYNNRYKKYIKREKILKTTTQKTGYLMLTLCKDKKKSNLLVHRIIAKTFLSNPNNYPQVNHKDGNKKNNCVDNLEWCTSKQNNKHAFDTGLNKYNHAFDNYHFTKKVGQYDLNDNFIKEFDSITKASVETNTLVQSICKVCKGKRKKAGGYIWKYL